MKAMLLESRAGVTYKTQVQCQSKLTPRCSNIIEDILMTGCRSLHSISTEISNQKYSLEQSPEGVSSRREFKFKEKVTYSGFLFAR